MSRQAASDTAGFPVEALLMEMKSLDTTEPFTTIEGGLRDDTITFLLQRALLAMGKVGARGDNLRMGYQRD